MVDITGRGLPWAPKEPGSLEARLPGFSLGHSLFNGRIWKTENRAWLAIVYCLQGQDQSKLDAVLAGVLLRTCVTWGANFGA